MSDHITELQARNTELVEENRRLRAALNEVHEEHCRKEELDYMGAHCAPCEVLNDAAPVATVATMVREFMDKYNQPRADRPTLQDEDMQEFRSGLLWEEWQEWREADVNNDIVRIADSLADMVYVIYGTAETYGIPLDRVIAEVHRSNMTKTAAGDGKKVAKGEGYEPPKIKEVLECQ